MAARYSRAGVIAGGNTGTQAERRAANIDRVRELLPVRPMSAAELAALVDVPTATMNGYLYHLAAMGEARRISSDDQRAKLWVADEQSVEEAADKARVEYAQRAQIVKAQQVGMQRHWMDVALFGPAREAA